MEQQQQHCANVERLLTAILDQLIQLNQNISNSNYSDSVSQMERMAERRRAALENYRLQWERENPRANNYLSSGEDEID